MFALGIVTMTVVLLVILTAAGVIFVAITRNRNGRMWDVFYFNESGDLVVNAGIPVTYRVSDIERILLSWRSRRGYLSGTLQVVKTNGRKSRIFFFDASANRKKVVFISKKEEIEAVIYNLADKLDAHYIPYEIFL